MTADIVADALTMAWFRKRPESGLLHHSDRGSQYASQVFQDKLKKYGMRCSMSRKGNCWDNAPMESCFNSFKNEGVHGEKYETQEALNTLKSSIIASACIQRSAFVPPSSTLSVNGQRKI
jgi:transposase InsO family protein